MAAWNGPGMSHSDRLVILLLGGQQSGKSSAGNAILGRAAFTKNTTHSCREEGTHFGKQVSVVDTPGWFSSSTTPDRVSEEVCRGLTLCHPELHAILLVLPTNSIFGREELRAMEAQLRLFQIPIWHRAMVLFTHEDKLGAVSIQKHIKQQGRTLHWLLERCANRYQVLTTHPSSLQAQVTELLEKIQRMMETSSSSRETQNIWYSKLRQDLGIPERRWWGRQEDEDMTNEYDECDDTPGQKQQRASVRCGLPLTFVLLGRRKSGKSSAGNIILDREEFQIHQYGRTTRCSVGRGTASGRAVTVVDTPGWSPFSFSSGKEVKAEIHRSLSLCSETNKVTFLLAIPVDSFGNRDRRALEEFVGVLGESVWRRAVVLFTYGGELRGTTIQKHIEKKGEHLQQVLLKCGHRQVVFDTETGDGDQVKQLLETVDRM